ncbi:MAG: AMIN domain-containing protein [Deltaproteobacteria bacterium]|nr:AMIN domain-containing protein [Deltaproteobacteria bacterium]
MKYLFLPLISVLFLLNLMVGLSRAADNEPQTTQKVSVSTTSLIVGEITFAKEKDGRERVCIPFNQRYMPEIFSIPGKKPRIVVDLKEVSQWPEKAIIPTNGLLIQQVRMHLYSNVGKLRIVLDLDPSMDYGVSPSYYEGENIYCIDVSRK